MPAPIGPNFNAKAMLTVGRAVHQPFEVPTDMTKSAMATGSATHELVSGASKAVFDGLRELKPIGPLAKLIDGLDNRLGASLQSSAAQAQKATEQFWIPFSNAAHQTGFAVSNPFATFYAQRAGFDTPADPAAAQDMLANIVDSKGWPAPAPTPVEEPVPTAPPTASTTNPSHQPDAGESGQPHTEDVPKSQDDAAGVPATQHGAEPGADLPTTGSDPSGNVRPQADDDQQHAPAAQTKEDPGLQAALQQFATLPPAQQKQIIERETAALQQAAAQPNLTAEQQRTLATQRADLEMFTQVANRAPEVPESTTSQPTEEPPPATSETEMPRPEDVARSDSGDEYRPPRNDGKVGADVPPKADAEPVSSATAPPEARGERHDAAATPPTGGPRTSDAAQIEITPEVKSSLERFSKLPAEQRAQLIKERGAALQRAAADTKLTTEQRQELKMAQAELELFARASNVAGAAPAGSASPTDAIPAPVAG